MDFQVALPCNKMSLPRRKYRWARLLTAMALTMLPSFACFAQTKVQGGAQIQGGAQANSQFTHSVQIMALYPPAYNSAPNSDYNNFRNNVMNQSSVDGVTLEIVWSNVEMAGPSSTSCGANTDVCQLDSGGQYHSYSWINYDSPPSGTMYLNSVVPWFDGFGSGAGVRKKVNLILTGINTSVSPGVKLNTATPDYVTSPSYVALFPYNQQDVLNFVNCAGAPWAGVTTSGTGVSYSQSTTTVTVTAPNCCGTGSTQFQSGDLIWVSGDTTNQINVNGVPITAGSGSFTYNTTAPGSLSTCPACVYIGAGQSSPVPYERPYIAAWQAFIAAANLHFGPNYTPNGTNVGAQLGYIRSGTWVGGESFVYCQSTLAGLGGPYAYTSSAVWTGDLLNKVNYVKSLSPTMVRYWPIDPGSDPNTMALNAISAGNAHGFNNGFGSQGLSAADYQPGGTGCSTANANWCSLFGTYHLLGVPLELQQISISDETESCVPASNCGTPPKSAGNMRLWLPFAVTNYATTFEMYYLDLALAYDSHYCTPSGTVCGPPSYHANLAFMDTTRQLTWYNAVGRGNAACPSGTTNTTNCYSAVIDAAHGPH
jgi:hypothetical protein